MSVNPKKENILSKRLQSSVDLRSKRHNLSIQKHSNNNSLVKNTSFNNIYATVDTHNYNSNYSLLKAEIKKDGVNILNSDVLDHHLVV